MIEKDIASLNARSAEAGVIATLIEHPDYYFFAENLLPSYFTDETNRIAYTAISMLVKRDAVKTGKIDPFMMKEILESTAETKRLAEIVTLEDLNDLIWTTPNLARNTPEEYQILANNVIDVAFRKDAYRGLQQCLNLCLNSNMDDLQQQIYTTMDDVITGYSSNNDMPLYSDVVDEIWKQIRDRQTGNTKAISTPFKKLNDFAVWEPGEVVCFTGGAKSGKSAMLLTCTVDLLRKGKSVLYIDSEISSQLFTMRILSHLTGIPFRVIREGKYSPEQERQLDEQREWLKQQRFIHIYMPVFDENSVYLAAVKAHHMIDIDCIVVDYLKSSSDSDDAFAVYSGMGRLSDCLKNRIAGDLNICGLTAAQTTASGRIADSARIARSVSTVVSITDKTDEEIELYGAGCGTKKLRVVLNRNGEQMRENEWIDLDFNGSTLTYAQAQMQHDPSLAMPY